MMRFLLTLYLFPFILIGLTLGILVLLPILLIYISARKAVQWAWKVVHPPWDRPRPLTTKEAARWAAEQVVGMATTICMLKAKLGDKDPEFVETQTANLNEVTRLFQEHNDKEEKNGQE